jgi:hypothetical protein
MSIGAPLFQRPTIRAPRRSLPSSGVKIFPFPSSGRWFFVKNSSNSGTCWKSQRKATKLPSRDQSCLIFKPGSPVWPVTITPGSTGLGPGGMTVSKPLIRGLEIPSKKPKLGQGSVSILKTYETYCSCPDSAPGRTSPLMVMIFLMEGPKIKSISSFFLSVVSWLSPEISMSPCKSWRKRGSQSGVLPSGDFGSSRLLSASTS